MSKRKPIPKMTPPAIGSIDDLLDPKTTTPVAPKATVKKTVKQKKGKTERQKKSNQAGQKKSKTTFYFPTELTERVDIAHAQARVYTRGSKYKISKSEFMEAVINYALAEFDKNGQDSDVVAQMWQLLD